MAIYQKTLALAGAALLVTGIAGCSNPVESLGKEVIEEQTDVSIDKDGDSYTIETDEGDVTVKSGGEIPSDFPSDVPLPNGTLTASQASPTMWILTYEGIDRSEIDALVQEIEAAGFTQIGIADTSEMVQGTFERGELGVTVMWTGSDPSTPLIYGVTVIEQ